MRLALTEIRRSTVRFGLLVGAITLLVFLILLQQALRDGLITGFVGALRNQSAPVVVYGVDAQRTLQGSLITPELEEQILGTDGIAESTGITEATFVADVAGDEHDVTLLGAEDPDLFHPTNLDDGRRPEGPLEAIGSAADFSVGDSVAIAAGDDTEPLIVEVVGVAREIQLSVAPTLFVDAETVRSVVSTLEPEREDSPPNALALHPEDDVTPTELVAAINNSVPDAEALTRADAADRAPGVAQVTRSFQLIFLLYGLVVPLVTGLFFLILTLQKSRSLTLLRAIGARTSVLVRNVLLQVVIVVCLGLTFGTLLYYPLTRIRVGGLTLRFDPMMVLTWAALLLLLALLSCLASLRQVLRIDPAEATIGEGGR